MPSELGSIALWSELIVPSTSSSRLSASSSSQRILCSIILDLRILCTWLFTVSWRTCLFPKVRWKRPCTSTRVVSSAAWRCLAQITSKQLIVTWTLVSFISSGTNVIRHYNISNKLTWSMKTSLLKSSSRRIRYLQLTPQCKLPILWKSRIVSTMHILMCRLPVILTAKYMVTQVITQSLLCG